MCGGQCQCFDSICNAQITWRTCRSVLNTFQSISEKRFDNSKKTKPEKKKRNQRRSKSFSCRIQIETLRHTLKSCVCVFVFIGWLVNGMRGAGALRA